MNLPNCPATGKRVYATRALAMNARHELAVRTGDTSTSPYQCEACGRWHIGHATVPGKPRRRKMSHPYGYRHDPDSAPGGASRKTRTQQ